jgi:hypothetical protein
MIERVDLSIRDVVYGRRRDVARRERDRRPDVLLREALQPDAVRGSEEHERPQHRGHAVAKHANVEGRKRGHFGTTTRRGQAAVSARM